MEKVTLDVELSNEDIEVIEKTKANLKCPECGTELFISGHCATCPDCGWSLCSM